MVVLQCYSIPVIKHAVAALQRSSTAASIAAAQRFSVPFRMQRSALQRCSVQCCSECAASQCAAFSVAAVQCAAVQRSALQCETLQSALQNAAFSVVAVCSTAATRCSIAVCRCCSSVVAVLQCCNAATLHLLTAHCNAARCTLQPCIHKQGNKSHSHIAMIFLWWLVHCVSVSTCVLAHRTQ